MNPKPPLIRKTATAIAAAARPPAKRAADRYSTAGKASPRSPDVSTSDAGSEEPSGTRVAEVKLSSFVSSAKFCVSPSAFFCSSLFWLASCRI